MYVGDARHVTADHGGQSDRMTDTTTSTAPSDDDSSGSTEQRYHHGDLPTALVEASAELVSERGPSGFSLREVARRAGVSHAAPAHHFGSVNGLLTAVAVEGFRRLDEALGGANETTDDPIERLRASGKAYVEMALRSPGHYAVMFADELLDHDDPRLVEHGTGAYGHLLDCITNIRDQLRPDLDVESAATMTWSTMAGLVVLSPMLGDVAEKNDLTLRSLDDLIDRFADFFLHGFVGTD